MYNPTIFTFGSFINSPTTAPITETLLRTLEPSNQVAMCTITAAAGNGKTHLMRAIVHAAGEHDQSAKYVRAGEITNYKELLNPQVLVIDDLDSLSVTAIQDKELANVIEDRMITGRKTFFAAEPRELHKALPACPRVGTRITWGPKFIVPPPDTLVVRELIRRIFDEQKILLNAEEISTLVAVASGHDTRETIQVIMTVLAYMQHTPSFNVAIHQVLPKAPVTLNNCSIEDIINFVGDYYKVPPAELLSKRRTRRVTQPRHIAMYIAKKMHGTATVMEIAESFGKDHTTLLHGVNAVRSRLLKEPELQEDIDFLMAHLRSQAGQKLSE